MGRTDIIFQQYCGVFSKGNVTDCELNQLVFTNISHRPVLLLDRRDHESILTLCCSDSAWLYSISFLLLAVTRTKRNKVHTNENRSSRSCVEFYL